MIYEFRGEYEFLSNFYAVDFVHKNDLFRTAEHAFHAAKAEDPLDYFRIRDAKTPAMAKFIGRKCKMRPDWDKIKIDVMRGVLRSKFAVPAMTKKLIDTWPHELSEGNRWGDTFWGVDLKTGKGQNILGTLLMEIREEVTHS